MQVWHFLGQKLRLGGDALGADPTCVLYLSSRSLETGPEKSLFRVRSTESLKKSPADEEHATTTGCCIPCGVVGLKYTEF